MEETPTITAADVRAHYEMNDLIERRLQVLGKEIHKAQRAANGEKPHDTVLNGSLDKWDLDGENVEARFYITGRYSYEDWETVTFPASWLDSEDWRAELEEQAAKLKADYQREQARRAEKAAVAKEAQERAQLAKLKEKYES